MVCASNCSEALSAASVPGGCDAGVGKPLHLGSQLHRSTPATVARIVPHSHPGARRPIFSNANSGLAAPSALNSELP